jgi:hypothetical protein
MANKQLTNKKEIEMGTKIDYSDYIHEYTDGNKTKFCVAKWDERSGEYYLPMNNKERELTGCHTYFAKTLEGIGGYYSRAKARYEAKRRFEL